MSLNLLYSSLKFASVGKMWGRIGMRGEIKSAVSYCLTAPCFLLRPASLVLEGPSAWDGSGPVSEIFQPKHE